MSLGRTGLAGLCAKSTENQGPFYGWKGSRWAAVQNSDRTRVLEVVHPILCSRPDARVSSARLEAPAILLPLCHSGWDYNCVQDHIQLLMWVLGSELWS